ncbi:hypothetical protein M2375_003948 [Comamonas sp. BIGb0152]|uniref:hypothetical protein n=1 Tax=Comamonas sp. BIGb0152 TaxID=2940601 RepID=UPI0021676FC6|nr:hypothetical protein [Comamonas sp. BIGb0152]MCS4295701.1 hypothetical protein [Comamonas sp. BIGb0152]
MVAFLPELWLNYCMSIRKSQAIEVLGGTVGAAVQTMPIIDNSGNKGLDDTCCHIAKPNSGRPAITDVGLHDVGGQRANTGAGCCDSSERCAVGSERVLPAGAFASGGGQAPNAFSRPLQSIASTFSQKRVSKTVDRNPRYLGYFIESGAQAEASHTKTQRILKGAL